MTQAFRQEDLTPLSASEEQRIGGLGSPVHHIDRGTQCTAQGQRKGVFDTDRDVCLTAVNTIPTPTHVSVSPFTSVPILCTERATYVDNSTGSS